MNDKTRMGQIQDADERLIPSTRKFGVEGGDLDCDWFLDVYSDYRDNRLNPWKRQLASAHIAACPRCRRYDRVLRTGVAVLRDEESLPGSRRGLEVATLRDLAWQQERTESQALGGAGSGMTTAGLVLVALLLCVFAWFPLLKQEPVELELDPVVATLPAPAPLAPLAPPLFLPRPLPPLLSAPPTLFSSHPPGFPLFFHSAPFAAPAPPLSLIGPQLPHVGNPTIFRSSRADPALADYGTWLARPPSGGIPIVIDHD